MQMIESQYIKFSNAMHWNCFRPICLGFFWKKRQISRIFIQNQKNHQNLLWKFFCIETRKRRETWFYSIVAAPTAKLLWGLLIQKFQCISTGTLRVPGSRFPTMMQSIKCSTIFRVRCSTWTSRRICSRYCSSECVLDFNSSKWRPASANRCSMRLRSAEKLFVMER